MALSLPYRPFCPQLTAGVLIFVCACQQPRVAQEAASAPHPDSIAEAVAPAPKTAPSPVQPAAVAPAGRSGKSASAAAMPSAAQLKPAAIFRIDTRRDTVLHCPEGTILTIPADAFLLQTSGAAVQGTVSVLVQEYYSLTDMLLANLSTTTSKGELLETGGMLYLEAKANGKQCKLRPASRIAISLPCQQVKEGMQLFTSSQNKRQQPVWKPVAVSDSWENTDNTVYIDLEPQYPGGEAQFQKDILGNIKPIKDLEGNAIKGKVFIAFSVNAKGFIEDITVEKSLHPLADQYAVQLVKSLRKFTVPQEKGRRNARFRYILPIAFSDTDEENFKWSSTENNRQQEQLQNMENQVQLNEYMLSTPTLGWINCDRYINDPRPKVDYVLPITDRKQAAFKLVLHDVKSIINGSPSGSGVYFGLLPKGLPVTIIALEREKEQTLLALHNTFIGEPLPKELKFEALSREQLQTAIGNLNSLHVK